MLPQTTRFQSLLEAMPDAFVGVDQSGVIRFLNRRTESLFGYDRGQLIGQRLDALVPESFQTGHPAHRASYLVDLATRSMGVGLELTGQRRDGTQFPVEVSLTSFRTREGPLVTAAVRDVSDRKKAEQDLQRMATAIEFSGEAIITSTPDSHITSWNPAAARLFGYSSEEMLGRSSRVLSHRGRATELRGVMARLDAGQPVENLATERVRKDGTAFPALLTVSPIHDAGGAIVGAVSITRDVTEQIRIEMALAEAGRHYRLLAENASDLVVLASPDRVITWVSPSVTRKLGWTPEDLIGTRLDDLIHPDDAAATAALRDAVYSGDEITQPADGSVLRIRTKCGRYRRMSGDVTAVNDESGLHVGVVSGLRDVEALVQAREKAHADRAALRATLDSLLDPHVRFEAVRDETGKIVDFTYVEANPAACSYLGMDYQDLVGTRMLDLFPGVTGAGLLAQYRRVVETGEPLVVDDVVYAHELRSKQDRHLDVRSTRVGDGLSQTWRDVTDRYLGARALAESEAQYRLLAENASDVVMRLGPNLVFEWLSGSVTEVLGWRGPSLVGHPIDEFIHPEDLPWFRQVFAEAGPGSTAWVELRFRRSDCAYQWVACRTRVTVDEAGTPVAVVGSLVDVQDHKVAQLSSLARVSPEVEISGTSS
jgi:PAS domain S-box-containing protein